MESWENNFGELKNNLELEKMDEIRELFCVEKISQQTLSNMKRDSRNFQEGKNKFKEIFTNFFVKLHNVPSTFHNYPLSI